MQTHNQPRSAGIFGFTLLVAAFVLNPWGSLLAQSQEPQKPATEVPQKPSTEVQQLKERLQQLEETVEKLKAQISTVEESQTSATKTDVAVGTQISSSATSTTAPMAAAPKSEDEGKGESTFAIYGFAMLDFGYQFRQADPNWFDTVRPVKLPDRTCKKRYPALTVSRSGLRVER